MQFAAYLTPQRTLRALPPVWKPHPDALVGTRTLITLEADGRVPGDGTRMPPGGGTGEVPASGVRASPAPRVVLNTRIVVSRKEAAGVREPRLSNLGTGTERPQLPSQTPGRSENTFALLCAPGRCSRDHRGLLWAGNSARSRWARRPTRRCSTSRATTRTGVVTNWLPPPTWKSIPSPWWTARSYAAYVQQFQYLNVNCLINFRSRAERQGNAGKCTDRAYRIAG